MSCSNSSASARQKCKKTVCLLAGNCGCNPKSSFFAGPRTLLQDLTCGSNCDAPITVEAWSGGAPGTSGATGTTVGLELCDKLVFWSESLDIQVTEGSAVVNLEIAGATGGVAPDFWRDDLGNPPNGVGDTGKSLVHYNDINVGVSGNMTVGNRGNSTDTVVGNGAMASGGIPGGRVAIGYQAGNTGQQANSVAIGKDAGRYAQQGNSVAIGLQAGETNQGTQNSDALMSGFTGPSVAIGYQAGQNVQENECVAIGYQAGNIGQKYGSVAIGSSAGFSFQHENAIAIGNNAGFAGSVFSNQPANTICIGQNSGFPSGATGSIALGTSAIADKSNQLAIHLQGTPGQFKTFFEAKDTMAAPAVSSLVYIKIGNAVYALHATKNPVAPNNETILF
jgi:hypothetical protein